MVSVETKTVSIRASKKRLLHIFDAVAISMSERMAPLCHVETFKNVGINVGIEGWFKVEVIHALRNVDPVLNPQNKGPDLVLREGVEIELKGGNGFNIKWYVSGLKYGVPCLFLGWTGVPTLKTDELKKAQMFETVGVKRLCGSGWHVGMIVPPDYFRA